MRALGAPPLFIAPLHYLRIFPSPYFRTFSPSPLRPLIKLLYFHSSTRPIAGITSMAAGERLTSDWFSVPDLRLRDHRFTVPLDYSISDPAAPKISVFAREVVGGNYKLDLSIELRYSRCVCCCLLRWKWICWLKFCCFALLVADYFFPCYFSVFHTCLLSVFKQWGAQLCVLPLVTMDGKNIENELVLVNFHLELSILTLYEKFIRSRSNETWNYSKLTSFG